METTDSRHHMDSLLMRESLIDKDVMASTDNRQTPIWRMLPEVHVVKIGSSSMIDPGKKVLFPLIKELGRLLENEKIIFGVGGGARSRHVFSVGLDLGLPTGVLSQISVADALGNAHILGTLLSPYGVVAIPPEIFGHLLPLFIHSVPGVVYNGVPPYSLWEHPPKVGRIPPHRSDAGCLLLAECFGCKTVTLVKDVDGLYTEDPKTNAEAQFIDEIDVKGIRARKISTLPFDAVILDILENARLVDKFQIVNGRDPEKVGAALKGEKVGSFIYK